MRPFPPTLILRHRKENLKKCSLQGVEDRADMCFFTYPWRVPQPDLTQYIVLTLDGPPLTEDDAQKGIFLIDGTWRYAKKMFQSLKPPFEVRSLSTSVQTAYPRRQEDARGLASIEALYLSYVILGRDPEGLLDHYHWKEEFLRNELRARKEITRAILEQENGSDLEDFSAVDIPAISTRENHREMNRFFPRGLP